MPAPLLFDGIKIGGFSYTGDCLSLVRQDRKNWHAHCIHVRTPAGEAANQAAFPRARISWQGAGHESFSERTPKLVQDTVWSDCERCERASLVCGGWSLRAIGNDRLNKPIVRRDIVQATVSSQLVEDGFGRTELRDARCVTRASVNRSRKSVGLSRRPTHGLTSRDPCERGAFKRFGGSRTMPPMRQSSAMSVVDDVVVTLGFLEVRGVLSHELDDEQLEAFRA